jgi:hypothetical protein
MLVRMQLFRQIVLDDLIQRFSNFRVRGPPSNAVHIQVPLIPNRGPPSNTVHTHVPLIPPPGPPSNAGHTQLPLPRLWTPSNAVHTQLLLILPCDP